MDKRGFPPDRILAFAAGVVFLALLLAIAVWRPDLETNYLIRVVLAVAAAAFAVVIPGLLHFEPGRWLKAGGAMAVFAMVFWFAPRVAPPVGTLLTFSVPHDAVLGPQIHLLAEGRQLVAFIEPSCTADQLGSRLKGGTVSGKTVAIVIENLAGLADRAKVGTLEAVLDQDNGRVTVSCA